MFVAGLEINIGKWTPRQSRGTFPPCTTTASDLSRIGGGSCRGSARVWKTFHCRPAKDLCLPFKAVQSACGQPRYPDGLGGVRIHRGFQIELFPSSKTRAHQSWARCATVESPTSFLGVGKRVMPLCLQLAPTVILKRFDSSFFISWLLI